MGTQKAKAHARVRSTIGFLFCLAPLSHAATDRVGYTVGADFWIQLLAVGAVTEHDVPLPGGATVLSIGTLLESTVEQTGSGFADATADTTVEGYHLWGGVLDFTYSSAVANGYVYESGSAASSVTTGISIEVSNPSEESLAFQFGYDASVHTVFMGTELDSSAFASISLADDFTESLLYLSFESPLGHDIGNSASGYVEFGNSASGYLEFILGAGETNTITANLHSRGAVSEVPIPAAVWLFGSSLLALLGLARHKHV